MPTLTVISISSIQITPQIFWIFNPSEHLCAQIKQKAINSLLIINKMAKYLSLLIEIRIPN
jgi:hypothetical protein